MQPDCRKRPRWFGMEMSLEHRERHQISRKKMTAGKDRKGEVMSKKATTWRQAQKQRKEAAANIQQLPLKDQIENRLADFCSNFEEMNTEVGGALLKVRAHLIADGDTPRVWCTRTPFSSELTVLLFNLTELFNGDKPRAARELLRAMKEANCDAHVKEDYPLVYEALHLIAADDAKGAAALAAQCKAKAEAA